MLNYVLVWRRPVPAPIMGLNFRMESSLWSKPLHLLLKEVWFPLLWWSCLRPFNCPQKEMVLICFWPKVSLHLCSKEGRKKKKETEVYSREIYSLLNDPHKQKNNQQTPDRAQLSSPWGPLRNGSENWPKCFDPILQYEVHRLAHILVNISPEALSTIKCRLFTFYRRTLI